MECPCVCDCGNIFDLDDGFKSLNSNIVVCKKCHDSEKKQDEINDLIEQLNLAKDELDYYKQRIKEIIKELKDLGYKGDFKKIRWI